MSGKNSELRCNVDQTGLLYLRLSELVQPKLARVHERTTDRRLGALSCWTASPLLRVVTNR